MGIFLGFVTDNQNKMRKCETGKFFREKQYGYLHRSDVISNLILRASSLAFEAKGGVLGTRLVIIGESWEK